MNTKDKIRKEIDDLGRQIEELVKRREVLQADSTKIAASIEDRMQIISEALVAGHDVTEETKSLARDRVKLESLARAVIFINERIADLDFQHGGTIEAFWKEDLDCLAGEVEVLLAAGINKLYSSVDDLNAVKAKYKEFDQAVMEVGLRVDKNEHLRDMQRIYRYLLGDSGNGHGSLSRTIWILERRYAALLAQLSEKK